jgi:RNA 2',3'-cyclic 3'-phosphodiesterase
LSGGGDPRRPPKWRLFVALDLPREVRAALDRWRPRDDALRAVGESNLHLTLCFLGWRDEARVAEIAAAVQACAAPVGEVALGEAVWLPPRRPRVLAVVLDEPSGALAALQAAVVGAMVRVAGHEPEARPFRPHVTVARVRRGARARRGELPAPPDRRFVPPALTLYRSHMQRAGARYEPVVRAALARE